MPLYFNVGKLLFGGRSGTHGAECQCHVQYLGQWQLTKLTALQHKGCHLTTHHTHTAPLPPSPHRCPPVLHPCLVQMQCSWTGHRKIAPRCMWWTCGMAAAAHSPRRPALCSTGPTRGRARMAGARWLHIWPAVMTMGALPPGHCICRKAPAPPSTPLAPACRALPQSQPLFSPSLCCQVPSHRCLPV